ncbi:unnamed protein product, partial [Heterosigma akashiwo]
RQRELPRLQPGLPAGGRLLRGLPGHGLGGGHGAGGGRLQARRHRLQGAVLLRAARGAADRDRVGQRGALRHRRGGAR